MPAKPKTPATDPTAVKVLTPHKDDGGAEHAWVPNLGAEFRDRLGRVHKHATQVWHRMGCADGLCGAKALVRASVLADVVQHFHPAPKAKAGK